MHVILDAVRIPSKHEALAQCWADVGPSSATLAQHQPSIGPTPRVSWVRHSSRELTLHIKPKPSVARHGRMRHNNSLTSSFNNLYSHPEVMSPYRHNCKWIELGSTHCCLFATKHFIFFLQFMSINLKCPSQELLIEILIKRIKYECGDWRSNGEPHSHQ